MVSVRAFNSDDPSSKPTVFSVKFMFENNENKQIRGRGWPIFHKTLQRRQMPSKNSADHKQILCQRGDD